MRVVQNQKSGYLLRKFQNSNGWQRLWCVFSKCSLYFYRSPLDAAPIACLPLWGYSLTHAAAPGTQSTNTDGTHRGEGDARTEGTDETDSPLLHKAFTFKLAYKTHKYFFRTDNELQFTRWVSVLKTALMNEPFAI